MDQDLKMTTLKEAYDFIAPTVQAKIDMLKVELEVAEQKAVICVHYDQEMINKAMNKIIKEYKKYTIQYTVTANCLEIIISR